MSKGVSKVDFSTIDRDSYKISSKEFMQVIKSAGIPIKKVSKSRKGIIRIGCELLLLSYNDVVYMAQPGISDYEAQSRLSCKRKSSFNR